MKNSPSLFTVVSPALIPQYELNKAVVVIIDVFRATSTIAAALHNGAKEVIPVDSIEKAINFGKQINAIVGGERDGMLAPGFTHGNSPLEYTPEIIKDKTLILTTTNGTRLLKMVEEQTPDAILTGSFPNIGVVCEFLIAQQKPVVLACAGWKDRFNLEDTIFAGAVIEKIKKHFSIRCDSSLMAEVMYGKAKKDIVKFAESFSHYHRLVERFGLIKDIEYCLTPNVANVLSFYNAGRLISKT